MIFGFAQNTNMLSRAANPDDVVDDEQIVADDFGDRMRTVMPWVISFLAHLGVLILASLIAFGIQQVIKEKEVAAPYSEMGDEDIEGPLDRPPGPITGELGPMSDGAAPPPPDTVAPPMPTAAPTIGVSSAKAVSSSAISNFAAPVSVAAAGAGKSDHGTGIFRGVGGFQGGGGGGGGQVGAKRIVFLVDASGSLVDTLPFVLEDLRRMLDARMTPDKSFNVIFFSGNEVNRDISAQHDGIASLFSNGLEFATPANRKKAVEWIQKVEAGGSSDPLSAIKKALDMNPDQIHLLSDNITGSGIWEMHQDKFMAEVMKAYTKASEKRKFRIAFKTYQFVYKDPMETIGKTPTLSRLVKETGGIPERDYRFVTARELGLR